MATSNNVDAGNLEQPTVLAEAKNGPSHFWREIKAAFSGHPWKIIGLLLLMTSISLVDTVEVIPPLSFLVANPAFHYIHEAHDIFALALVAYSGYRYGVGVGVMGLLGFLAGHGYYIYIKLGEEPVEIFRLLILTGASFVVLLFMGQLRSSREELQEACLKIEAGLKRVWGLHGVAKVAAESSDINTMFHNAIPYLLKATGMEFASIHGYHVDTNVLMLLAHEGWLQEQTKKMSILTEPCALWKAVRTGKIVVQDPPVEDPSPMGLLMAEIKARVFLSVPLTVGGRVVGVMALASLKDNRVTEDILTWLEALGKELGLHLDRLLAFQELERQRVSATGLSRTLEVEQKQLIQRLMQHAKSVFDRIQLRHCLPTGHHSRVAEKALNLAKYLGWAESEIQSLEFVSRVYDLGLLQVPNSYFEGLDPLQPGKLSEYMKQHTLVTVEWVGTLGQAFNKGFPAIRNHHERWDGSGYPDGLTGETIPLSARLVAVVDAYDFLRMGFPSRAALSHPDALSYIGSMAGSASDPKIAEAFVTLFQHESA